MMLSSSSSSSSFSSSSSSTSLSQLVNVCKIHSLLDLRVYVEALHSLNDLNLGFGLDQKKKNGNGSLFGFKIADVYLRFLANTRIAWDGCLPLVYCVENGYELLAIELLRGINGIDVNCCDGKGKTALHAAVLAGRYNMCQLLLEEGANVECEIPGQSILQSLRNRLWASGSRIQHWKNLDMDKEICSPMAPMMFTFATDTPLVLACRLGHTHIAQLLLENGADPTGRKNRSGRSSNSVKIKTPLMEATMHGRLDLVEILLSIEAIEQEDHVAALEYAMKNSHSAMIKTLEKDISGKGSKTGTGTAKGSGSIVMSSVNANSSQENLLIGTKKDSESKPTVRSSFAVLSEAALPRILRKHSSSARNFKNGQSKNGPTTSRNEPMAERGQFARLETSDRDLADILLYGDILAVEHFLEAHDTVVKSYHLLEACMFNNVEALELLLLCYFPEDKRGLKTVFADPDTGTILNLHLIALSKGYTDMLRFLLKTFPDNSYIDTCIIQGAKLGRTSEVEIICNAYPGTIGAGVLEEALEAAACRGHADVIGVLFTYETDFLQKFSDSNGLRPYYCQRALVKAQKAGFEQCVIEILVAKPSMFGAINELKIGELPLFVHAAKFGLCKLLRVYCSNEQVDVNIKCPDTDRTALMWTYDYEILRILVSNERVDVNVTDSEGSTLFKLITKPKPVYGQAINLYSLFAGKDVILRKQCLQLLLTREDIDINKEFTYPPNYLMVLACPQWHLCNEKELLQVILRDERSDINAQDAEGRTFLSKCCYWQRWDDFVLALDIERSDINVNIPDNTGWNPLLLCVQHERTSEIFKLLQTPGIDVNYCMEDGWNAFLLAAAYGHDDIAELLVNFKSDIRLDVELNNMSPAEVAAINGHSASLLQTFGKRPGRRVGPYAVVVEEELYKDELRMKAPPHPRKQK